MDDKQCQRNRNRADTGLNDSPGPDGSLLCLKQIVNRQSQFLDQRKNNQLICVDCGGPRDSKTVWVCLNCCLHSSSKLHSIFEVIRCGIGHRHAFAHFQATKHSFWVDAETFDVWCFECRAQVYDHSHKIQSLTSNITVAETMTMTDDYLQPRHIKALLNTCCEVSATYSPNETEWSNGRNDSSSGAGSGTGSDSAFAASGNFQTTPIDTNSFMSNDQGGNVGFSNIGNTCFANAVLQALLHCPPLLGLILDLDGRFVGHATTRDSAEAEQVVGRDRDEQLLLRRTLADDFASLARKVWCGSFRACVPRDVIRDVTRLNPFFDGFSQHDAQEFLRYLLDNLHEAVALRCDFETKSEHKNIDDSTPVCSEHSLSCEQPNSAQSQSPTHFVLTTASLSSSTPVTTTSMTSPTSATATVTTSSTLSTTVNPKRRLRRSVIADIFQGYLRSEVQCSACGNKSCVEDPFFDLSFELPRYQQLERVQSERGSEALTPQPQRGWFGTIGTWLGVVSPDLSLQTCLHSFCTSDQLVQKDQYLCDRCKQKVDAVKFLSFCELPEVLCFHVKRFTHNSYFSGKLSQHVMFPIRGLDMTPFVPLENKQANSDTNNAGNTYDLFAVVRHTGGVSGGHYIAYCLHHVTGKWLEFDDRDVREVSEEEVSQQQAYLLFYRKVVNRERREAVTSMVDRALTQGSESPSDPIHYVSHQWLRKVQCLSDPGAVDNRNLCCEHGIPFPQTRPCFQLTDHELTDSADPASPFKRFGSIQVGRNWMNCCRPVSHQDEDSFHLMHESKSPAWSSLIAQFGGGPDLKGPGIVSRRCHECELPTVRLAEKEWIFALNAKDVKSRDELSEDGVYIVELSWLNAWRRFIDGGPRPGPITNHLLFDDVVESCTAKPTTPPARLRLKPNLKVVEDFRGVSGNVWRALLRIYTGGPVIHRRTLDIFGEELG